MTISRLSFFLIAQLSIFSASIGVTTARAADSATPSPSCVKPTKPAEFTSEWAVDQFMRTVEAYKSCIAEFVDQQREQARKHQDAANAAIEQWNNFVDWTPSRKAHTPAKLDHGQLRAGAGPHGE